MHPAHTSILPRLKRRCAVLCLALGVAGAVQAAGAASAPGANSTATAPYRLRIVGGRDDSAGWDVEIRDAN